MRLVNLLAASALMLVKWVRDADGLPKSWPVRIAGLFAGIAAFPPSSICPFPVEDHRPAGSLATAPWRARLASRLAPLMIDNIGPKPGLPQIARFELYLRIQLD